MASGGQREVVGPRLVVTYVVVVPEGNSHAGTSQLMLPFCSGGGVRVLVLITQMHRLLGLSSM